MSGFRGMLWQPFYLIGEKKPGEKWPFYSSDQYFTLTNNFTRLKLAPIKKFVQLFFLLNKNQVTEIFKKIIRFIIT